MLGIRLVTLLWALILGQAAVADNLGAWRLGSPPASPARTASSGRVQPGAPIRVAPFASSSSLRPHKHPHAFPLFGSLNDPTDDEMSDDPTDDNEAWDDLNACVDTNAPTIVWLQEVVCYLIASEAEFSPAWAEMPSSPFLAPQRLRC